VTDEGIKVLPNFKDLDTLSLQGTGITDAGLAILARLPKLQELDLQFTQTSRGAVEKLQQELPKTKIER
jgi:hypothetical protein